MDEPRQIGFTAAESTPRFPHDPKPPQGAPNVVAIVLDDTGFAQLGCLRLRHRDSAPGRAWPPVGSATTASTSRPCARRPGRRFFTGRNHHAVGMGFLADIPLAFPGYTPASPRRRPRCPGSCATPATRPWPSASGTSTPRWQRSAAGTLRHLAARPRVRALLRLPAGRHQPLDAEPRLRQPLHRAAAPARGGLPPERGPGRPGHPHGAGPAAGGTGQALLPLLRPRGHARPAPRHARVGRPLPRACSTRGGTPGGTRCSPASVASGMVPEGTVLTERPRVGAGLGRPARPTSGACSPASRRSSPAS